MAALSKIDRTSLHRLETGARKQVYVHEILRLSKILHCSWRDLLTTENLEGP